ncbi:MAG: DUF4258 domain-containing protein [Candidatus Omnitrophica bacterium]|nr:DUF4258 domain-containing protein [Candidatus Omnitrophota bacterium]
MTSIHYTKHALDVLKERKLSKELIESAMASPDWKEQVSGEIWCIFKRTSGRVLRVVIKDRRDSLTVVTAYFDRRKV